MNNRFKNIYFWLGLIGVVFSAAGINFETLTSWNLLLGALMSILNNPVAVVAVISAIVGVCVDPTTKGLSDGEK